MPALRDRKVQQDFSGGFSRDIAPNLIAENGCYDLVNGLLDEDGSPYRRGGTVYKSNAAFGAAGLTWIADVYLGPGGRTIFANSGDFGVLASDDATPVNLGGAGLSIPKQSASLRDLLFIGGGTIYGGSRKSASYSTGSVKVVNGSKVVVGTGTAWKANVDVGMLFQIGSQRVYAVEAVTSDTELLLTEAFAAEGGSGKAYALSPIHAVSGGEPYVTWDYVAACANRLVFVSGRTIKFTEVNNPHSFTNRFSTTNEHLLPDGVEGIGLATVGDTVLVFTTQGIWVLEGLALDIVDSNGTSQHRLAQLSRDVVLAGAAGLAGSGQRLIVPGTDGIYLMDGISSPTRISRPVERLYRQRIADGYRIGRAVVYRGHYFLPVIDGNCNVRDLLICCLDRPTRDRDLQVLPWSRFLGDGGEISAFAVRSTVDPRQPVLLGAQAREPSRVEECSTYFIPSDECATDGDGTVHNFDLITRDIETGGFTENVIRSLSLRYELSGSGAVLKVLWGDGSLDSAGSALWDEADWDEFEWSGEEGGAVFSPTNTDGPASDGRNPHRFRIGQRLRHGRFRISTSGPASAFALRSLEMDVRPSKAVRR